MDPFTAILINIVIGLVLTGVSTLAQQAFGPKPGDGRQVAGFRGTYQSGGQVPQSFLVGTIGVAGKLEYRNTWGNSGDVPNAYLVDVLSFGDLPVTAVTALWVNSQPVTLSGSAVTQGTPVPQYNDGSDHLWRLFHDGTQSVADSYLTGAFGSDADRPWQSDMVGTGIPFAVMTAQIAESLWTGFPVYMHQVQGIPLYDPRADTTAGGSGSQRWADPSTWVVTDNSAVIVYNILRGIHDPDGNHVWGGHASEWQLPYDVWAAAMDVCATAIDLAGGGTEPQFRGGREIFLNERPADVVQEFLVGANARMSFAGGRWYILCGAPGSADGSFTDADVLASEATSLEAFPNLDQIVNGATASYLEPAQAWEKKETAPYYRSDLEALDDGRRQLQAVDLGTVFSGTQAQRVLKAAVEESRRFVRHVVPLPPGFGVYRPLQVLSWTSAANGYTDKLFLITARTESPYGNVVLGLQEIDPADHDWDETTDEQALSFAPLTPIRPPAQEMTGWSAAPFTDYDSGGTGRRFGIEVTAPAGQVDVRAARVQIREDFGSNALKFDSDEYPYDVADADPHWRISQPFLLPAHDYQVRGKLVPPDGSGRTVNWSDWLDVTTPDVRFGADDFYGLDVTDVQAGLAWIGRVVDGLSAAQQRLAELQSEQDLRNFSDRQTMLRKLASTTGSIVASFEELVAVATGPDSAIGESITSLFVALGGSTSEVNIRFEASAGPTGYAARYGIVAAVNDVTYRSAALLIDVPTDPGDPTRVVLDADQVVITADGGTTVAALFESGTANIANARFGAFIADWAQIQTAVVANFVATTANIGDLQVSTVKIANAAVTGLVSNTGAGYSGGSVGTQTLAAVALATSYPFSIGGRLTIQNTSGSADTFTIYVQRASDSYTVAYAAFSIGAGATTYYELTGVSIPPSSGGITYNLKVLNNLGGTCTITSPKLDAAYPQK